MTERPLERWMTSSRGPPFLTLNAGGNTWPPVGQVQRVALRLPQHTELLFAPLLRRLPRLDIAPVKQCIHRTKLPAAEPQTDSHAQELIGSQA